MSVTRDVSQPEMSALKLRKLWKSWLMSVTPETHQPAMGPYFAVAAAAFELYSPAAVFREALSAKVLRLVQPGGGGESGGEGGGAGTPHTSSKSNRHPVPAVQPSASSATLQSRAPTAWQMASASVKVLLRAHGQPASDSPHTEQPLRRDPQYAESLTSEQQRTWPQMCGCFDHMHRPRTCVLYR